MEVIHGGNTAEVSSALLSRTTGIYNTAIGIYSLLSLTGGNFRTGVGAGTLFANTADENTATGAEALFSKTTDTVNTANGFLALLTNTTGAFNTANGALALFSNTTGDVNVATGQQALNHNTTGDDNVVVGPSALFSSTTGTDNVAINFIALQNNTDGSGNIALGNLAGAALTTGNSNIDIGNNVVGVAGEANTLRIGQSIFTTFIALIRGVTTGNADAIPVLIHSASQLVTLSSSRGFKHDIKPMDEASEAILALKPVAFHYKSDKTSTPHSGLVAEEVAEVNSDLVVRDENGDIYTVRYDAEFLKEHRKVQQQQQEIDSLKAELREQRNQIQNVSEQIE